MSSDSSVSASSLSSRISSLKSLLANLNAERSRLETEIAGLDPRQGEALTDSEGFPRADLPVHDLRIIRNRRAGKHLTTSTALYHTILSISSIHIRIHIHLHTLALILISLIAIFEFN